MGTRWIKRADRKKWREKSGWEEFIFKVSEAWAHYFRGWMLLSFIFNSFFLFLFLATSCDLWNLSSSIWDWTQSLGSESAESITTGLPGNSQCFFWVLILYQVLCKTPGLIRQPLPLGVALGSWGYCRCVGTKCFIFLDIGSTSILLFVHLWILVLSPWIVRFQTLMKKYVMCYNFICLFYTALNAL